MCWSATKACFSTSCNRRSYRSSPPPPAPARAAAPARPRRGKGRAFPRSVSPYLRHRRFDACAYATFFSSPPSPGTSPSRTSSSARRRSDWPQPPFAQLVRSMAGNGRD
jgi:hypothetical protein